jgi:hypothetical protein
MSYESSCDLFHIVGDLKTIELTLLDDGLHVSGHHAVYPVGLAFAGPEALSKRGLQGGHFGVYRGTPIFHSNPKWQAVDHCS